MDRIDMDKEGHEKWRHISENDRANFLGDVVASMAERQRKLVWQKGREVEREKYGNEFRGDPLSQAWEELLDGLFYIWIAMRKAEIIHE